MWKPRSMSIPNISKLLPNNSPFGATRFTLLMALDRKKKSKSQARGKPRKQRCRIRNEVEPSGQKKSPEGSTQRLSAQYFRPILQVIYHMSYVATVFLDYSQLQLIWYSASSVGKTNRLRVRRRPSMPICPICDDTGLQNSDSKHPEFCYCAAGKQARRQ